MKLNSYGVRYAELEWFASYLFNRKQIVNYSNTLSQPASLTCGVPQGSILGPLLFIIYANDIVDIIQNSRIIKYADDTVLYIGGKTIDIIETHLSHDLNLLSEWFEENELILNLKKGKTEAMVFGTAKRLSMVNRDLVVQYPHHTVSVTTSYRYLGVDLDPALTFNDYFASSYKKATGRLHLLNKLRYQLNTKSAVAIYKSLILPVLTYCSLLFIYDNKSKSEKLASIDSRAIEIVNRNTDEPCAVVLPSITSIKKKRACMFVRKCLDNTVCSNFENYYTVLEHDNFTKNKSNGLKLPRVRTEFGKRSVYFAGAKVYNELPISVRKSKTFSEFRNSVNLFFN